MVQKLQNPLGITYSPKLLPGMAKQWSDIIPSDTYCWHFSPHQQRQLSIMNFYSISLTFPCNRKQTVLLFLMQICNLTYSFPSHPTQGKGELGGINATFLLTASNLFCLMCIALSAFTCLSYSIECLTDDDCIYSRQLRFCWSQQH